MRTLEQVKKEIKKTPPVECDFKVGDVVTFTNDYGVSFPGKKVIGFADDTSFHGNFIYLDYDCYWFPTNPESLTKEQPKKKGKQTKTRPILGYCDYSETIRQMPENYLIAHKDGNAWKCEPDLAADKELCIKVFTELLNYESKWQTSGIELLAKLTPTY